MASHLSFHREDFSPWIPAGDKARVDAALRTLRPLVPPVACALKAAWGPAWKEELHRRLRQQMRTPLEDGRFFLRVIGSDERLAPNPVRDLFVDLPPSLADALLGLANKVQHEDPEWTGADADRAEDLASAIVTCTRPTVATAYAAVQRHHQEVFRIERGLLYHRWFPVVKERWSKWHLMKAARSSSVAAVGSGEDRLDLFLLTLDGRVDHRIWQQAGGWGPWRALIRGGQVVTGPLGTISREPGHLEIFAIGETGAPVHRWAWNEDWSDWHEFPTPAHEPDA